MSRSFGGVLPLQNYEPLVEIGDRLRPLTKLRFINFQGKPPAFTVVSYFGFTVQECPVTVFKTIGENFGDFKRLVPLRPDIASDIGKLAAWMDLSAAFCGIPCSERSTAGLDQLARKLSWEFQFAVADQQVLSAALQLTFYPFVTANNVIWQAAKPSFTKIDTQTSDQSQMQALSKGDAILLKENTQRHLAWRAEIALRHGGNYKLALERMMEPLSGFADLAEAQQQRITANQQIQMLAQMRNRPAVIR